MPGSHQHPDTNCPSPTCPCCRVPGSTVPCSPAGNGSQCRGPEPGGTGWAGLLLAGMLGYSWPTATAAWWRHRRRPAPIPPCSCVLLAPSWGSPPPLLPPGSVPMSVRAIWAGGVHTHASPGSVVPTLHVSHQPPASTQTSSHSKVSLLLKTVPLAPEVTAGTAAGRRWVLGHPGGCALHGSRLAAAGGLGTPCAQSRAGGHTPVPLPPRGHTGTRCHHRDTQGPAATAGPGSACLWHGL